jgi:predicted PurR-regulated permease PerM
MLRSYVVIAVIEGAIVAGIAAKIGSRYWWLWGAVVAVATFVTLCACYFLNEDGRPNP